MPIPFLIPGSLGLLGELQLFENPANGSNYVGFRAPAALSASKIWTLPLADGSEDHVLKTDGAGQLAFGPVDWTELANVPSTFTPSSHTHAASDLSSGTVSLTRGGTGNDLNSVVAWSMCAINGSNQIAGIGPNTSATRKYFGMTGTGSAGAIPTWTQVGWTELTGVPGSLTPSSHTHAASDIASGTLAVGVGGTSNSAFATGGLVFSDGTKLSNLSNIYVRTDASFYSVALQSPNNNYGVELRATNTGSELYVLDGPLDIATIDPSAEITLSPTGSELFRVVQISGEGRISFFAVTAVSKQTGTDLASVISLLQAYGHST